MEPVWNGDVELHECGYWHVGLCAGLGGGGGVDVGGADCVGSGRGVGGVVGGGCGNNGSIGNVSRSWLCGSGI